MGSKGTTNTFTLKPEYNCFMLTTELTHFVRQFPLPVSVVGTLDMPAKYNI